jgi:hydroxymethylpyrimidine/phosphomethylpyrimidine kinase
MSQPEYARPPSRIPNVLSIAGIDPSGGAGLLADIKAFSALGAYGCGVVAALTAQNTRAVTGIQEVPPAFLRQQLDTLFDDVRVEAVKIGMLASAPLIDTVADVLARIRPRFVVLDPVMVAKSGDRLLRADAVAALKARLLPLATLVTPNLPEAADLLGHEVADTPEAMRAAAEALHAAGAGAVLVKGGHGRSETLTDVLFDGVTCTEYAARRVRTRNTHGTGCTFSSAIAALLPQRETLAAAVADAHAYVAGAIRAADWLDVGGGHGPLNHFFRWWPAQKAT